jgi:hypothetical protein
MPIQALLQNSSHLEAQPSINMAAAHTEWPTAQIVITAITVGK